MSHRQAKKERSHLSFLALLGTLWIAALSPPSALAQDPACAGAETLPPGSILRRHHETPPAEPELVRVPVSEPGVLELYVSGGARDAAPRISFLGTGCGSPAGEGASWVRIRETPRELHLMIREPGDFFAGVSSEDPGVPLADYALHATFAAERPAPDEVIALAADPPADCQAGDLPSFSPEPIAESRFVVMRRDGFTRDVDPWDDDGMSGRTSEPGVLVVEAPDAALDASLHDGESCTFEQRVAEGTLDGAGAFVAAPVHAGAKRLLLAPRSVLDVQYDVYVRHFALCADATDDHPDRPLCATVLSSGDDVSGALATGDDEDNFTFTLAGQEAVAVDLTGGDGARGVLYDEDGQRLEAWAAGRLVRTLGPGRFYILVAGVEGWTGEYGVRVETLP